MNLIMSFFALMFSSRPVDTILLIMVGGTGIFSLIQNADRIDNFFRKLRITAFFRYHSGHGAHSLRAKAREVTA